MREIGVITVLIGFVCSVVGDIPQPQWLNSRSRAASASRESLSSKSTKNQPMTRTVSRSYSVLSPWTPRHLRDGYEINYSQQSNNNNNHSLKVSWQNTLLQFNHPLTTSLKCGNIGKTRKFEFTRRMHCNQVILCVFNLLQNSTGLMAFFSNTEPNTTPTTPHPNHIPNHPLHN